MTSEPGMLPQTIPDQLRRLAANLDTSDIGWESTTGPDQSVVSTKWSGAADWSGPIDDRELVIGTPDAALADWIAAACPATVLRLLDRIDHLEQQLAAPVEAGRQP